MGTSSKNILISILRDILVRISPYNLENLSLLKKGEIIPKTLRESIPIFHLRNVPSAQL